MAIPNDKAILRSMIDGSLTEITDETVPGVTAITRKYALSNFPGLTRVELSNLTTIGETAFYYCPDLETVNLPNVTSIGANAFCGCKAITNLYIPSVVTISSSSFRYIGKNGGDSSGTPRDIVLALPNLTTISGSFAFDRSFLLAVDIGTGLTNLPSDTFYNNMGNQTIGTLVLRRTAGVVSAASTGAINGLRTVYVPSALISDYQTATNWSTRYSNGYITFNAIEGSQYEHYYADGTPIT